MLDLSHSPRTPMQHVEKAAEERQKTELPVASGSFDV